MNRKKRNIYMYALFILSLCIGLTNNLNALDSISETRLEKVRHNIFASFTLSISKARLSDNRYDVSDINDIIKATSDTDQLRRDDARLIIANKMGKDAIPLIKKGLDESRPLDRINTARLLVVLGDLNGMNLLKKEMYELVKDDYRFDSLTKKQKRLSSDIQTKGLLIIDALYAALFLAEFGDCNGYEIAKFASESKYSIVRSESVYVLMELCGLDVSTIEANILNPEALLLSVAESETDPLVLSTLVESIDHFKNEESRIRLLEKLQQSKNMTAVYQAILKRKIEKYIKTSEK